MKKIMRGIINEGIQNGVLNNEGIYDFVIDHEGMMALPSLMKAMAFINLYKL